MSLYDPGEFPSEVPTPVTVLDFTVAEFAAWVGTKPADETYDYCVAATCAMAQFLMETGRSKNPLMGLEDWRDDNGKVHHAPIAIKLAVQEREPGSPFAWTFGALAKRLQALSA